MIKETLFEKERKKRQKKRPKPPSEGNETPKHPTNLSQGCQVARKVPT